LWFTLLSLIKLSETIRPASWRKPLGEEQKVNFFFTTETPVSNDRGHDSDMGVQDRLCRALASPLGLDELVLGEVLPWLSSSPTSST
jgi:hypothetical protein